MSGKKKIAIVYDAIFPYVTGGAEKRFFETGKRLAMAGHEVHLYGMKSWEGPETICRDGMILHGIMRKESLYTPDGRRSIGEALRFGFACRKLYHEDFDIIDCCGFPYFPLFMLRIIAWLKHKPLYSTWHEVWGFDYWRKYLGIAGIFGYLVELAASRMPDRIISVSISTTESLERRLGRRQAVFTIPNGLDLKKIASAERHPGRNWDIVFVGRLLAYKNIGWLVRAVGEIKKEYPSLSLLIIGDGPERGRLEEMIRENDLQKNVELSGFIEENKLFSYMKSSKMLALPSSREGFGMVVLEANACGLPVLTVDEPLNAARNLIREGRNGSVVALEIESIADGIRRLLSDAGSMDPSIGTEMYDWVNITSEIDKIYTDNH